MWSAPGTSKRIDPHKIAMWKASRWVPRSAESVPVIKIRWAAAMRFGWLTCDVPIWRAASATCFTRSKRLARPPHPTHQSLEDITRDFRSCAERLGPFITDTTYFLLDAVEAGRPVLFEGAQGALLDLDHGTFPFVTSSNSSGVGVCAGSGVPPRWIDRVLGVLKSYTTRVGGGPFPTELADATGDRIRERGKEFGTTTGRPRRCGWLDAVAVRYTARVSGVHELAVMMLDVLSGFDAIQMCVAYEIDGQQTDRFPADVDALRRARPIYRSYPGWREEIGHVRDWSVLPAAARDYVHAISEATGVAVSTVSVGPDRRQTIRR